MIWNVFIYGRFFRISWNIAFNGTNTKNTLYWIIDFFFYLALLIRNKISNYFLLLFMVLWILHHLLVWEMSVFNRRNNITYVQMYSALQSISFEEIVLKKTVWDNIYLHTNTFIFVMLCKYSFSRIALLFLLKKTGCLIDPLKWLM